jgi:hypothetical protein
MSGWATVVLCLVLSAGVGWAQPRQRSWNDLSPGERERALQNYQEYQRLPRERQQFIDRRYQRYRELPPQERRPLRVSRPPPRIDGTMTRPVRPRNCCTAWARRRR